MTTHRGRTISKLDNDRLHAGTKGKHSPEDPIVEQTGEDVLFCMLHYNEAALVTRRTVLKLAGVEEVKELKPHERVEHYSATDAIVVIYTID